MVVDLWSSFEAHSLMNRELAPSSFHHASLTHDISTSLRGEQLGRLIAIDRRRRRLMPSMLTFPTSKDRNFLSSRWFFTKKASTFIRVKKDLSIDILFLQTRQNNNGNLPIPTGRSSAAEADFKDLKKQRLQQCTCMLQRSKVSVVTAYRDVTIYRA